MNDPSRMRPALAMISSVRVGGRGGVEALVRALCQDLAQDFPVHLVSPDGKDEVAAQPGLSCLSGHYPFVTDREWRTRMPGLLDYLRENKVVLAHFHLGGPYGFGADERGGGMIPAFRRGGIRCLSTNHQAVSPFTRPDSQHPVWKRLSWYLRRLPGKSLQLSAVDAEYLVSNHDLELEGRWYPWHRARLKRIYHSMLDGDAPALVLPFSKTIVCLGSWSFRKGQHILAEAFLQLADRHPEWILKLVGMPLEPACVQRLEQLAARTPHGHRIHLIGPTSDPLAVLAEAEIYVQPSLLEALGLSLQEAQYCGRPCIGTRVGGIPELIDSPSAGLLVPPNDPVALAAALENLIADRKQRDRLAAGARDAIARKKMTRQAMVANYREAYRETGLFS